jgi:hypothetical protein
MADQNFGIFPDGIVIGKYAGGTVLKQDPSGAILSPAPLLIPAIDGSTTRASGPFSTRTRTAIATINAGATTILTSFRNFGYKLCDAKMIAVGGNVGTVTTIDVLGTQGGSEVKLVAFGQANLTRSTVLRDGVTGGVVLADGASYVTCDTNTPIRLSKTGGAIDTATFIDLILTFLMEG